MRPSRPSAYLSGVGLVSRNKAAVSLATGRAKLPRLVNQALLISSEHFPTEPGHKVGRDRDAAIAALRDEGGCGGVVAGQQPELRAKQRPQAKHPAEIPGRILQPNEARQLGKPRDRLVGKADDGTGRHIIKNDGQASRAGNRAEVRMKPGLSRLVVVGHDRQDGVRASRLGVAGQVRSHAQSNSSRLRRSPARGQLRRRPRSG